MQEELIVMDLAPHNVDAVADILLPKITGQELGFERPKGWPYKDLTLAQLTVLAKKFGYQIKIQSIELCKINIRKAETENTADAATK